MGKGNHMGQPLINKKRCWWNSKLSIATAKQKQHKWCWNAAGISWNHVRIWDAFCWCVFFEMYYYNVLSHMGGSPLPLSYYWNPGWQCPPPAASLLCCSNFLNMGKGGRLKKEKQSRPTERESEGPSVTWLNEGEWRKEQARSGKGDMDSKGEIECSLEEGVTKKTG